MWVGLLYSQWWSECVRWRSYYLRLRWFLGMGSDLNLLGDEDWMCCRWVWAIQGCEAENGTLRGWDMFTDGGWEAEIVFDIAMTLAGGDGAGCACRGVVAGDVCAAGCWRAAECCVNLLGGLEDGGVAGEAGRCEVEDSCWEDPCFIPYLLRPAMCVVIAAIAGVILMSPLLMLQEGKRCIHAASTSWLSYLLWVFTIPINKK